MLIDNLAPIRKPVAEKDQIMQLLRGLGEDYNSIIASLTVCEVDVSIHSVHNILLTYEQRLCFQNLVAEGETISPNIAIQGRHSNTRKYYDGRRNNHFNNKVNSCHNQGGDVQVAVGKIIGTITMAMALDLSVNFVVNLAIRLLHANIDLISIFKVLIPYPTIPLILHHVILQSNTSYGALPFYSK